MVNDFLDLDIHFEDNAGQHNLTSVVRFDGATNPVVHGLRLRDHYPEQSGPLFKKGSGVSTVHNSECRLSNRTVGRGDPSWWDTASTFSVSGRIYNQDSSYVAPGTFNGTICVALECSISGHTRYLGVTPTVSSGATDCGTSPSVVGSESAGRVTVGSSTNGGKCTLTFATAWVTNGPACSAFDETTVWRCGRRPPRRLL
jgi:hypothetical protein